jgi:uncharacterized protein
MPPGVVRGLVALLAARAPKLESLMLGWFGGEPLLARDLIEKILVAVRELRRLHPQLAFSSDITTNAWGLTRPVFDQLVELGVTQFQIAFDGPRDAHDRKRVLAGGGGTFDRVWGNLLALRDAPGEFSILVRLHADQDNLSDLRRFLGEYEESFGADRRFRLFIRPLSRLGGPNDAALHVLEPEQERDAIGLLRRQAAGRDLGLFNPCETTTICYAARGNSFVIRADGRVNKCTVALEHPENQVGRLLEDGRIELSAPRMAGWMRGLRTGSEDELQCPMLGLADPELVSAGSSISSP